jgi:ParB family chromosome partitioning protein
MNSTATKFEIHPVANIFPVMSEQAFHELVADIEANGQREPVWLDTEGRVIDGRHRVRACDFLEREVLTETYEGDDPLGFAVSHNLHRNHYSESQRSVVAAKLATLKKGDNRFTIDTQICGSMSQHDAAEKLNVSVRSVQNATKVIAEAEPEITQAVEEGRLAVSAAVTATEFPPEVQREIAAAPEPAKAIKAHVANNSGNNEWYTPAKFIEAAMQAMGSIDTDPASCEFANQTVKATTFYTAETNGLDKVWTGNVWMNPPYAQPLISDFTKGCVDRYLSKEITQAIVLVNNATETEWFRVLSAEASAVCFPESRVKFIDPEGNATGCPLQGQAILYLGQNTKAFTDAFMALGTVWVKP